LFLKKSDRENRIKVKRVYNELFENDSQTEENSEENQQAAIEGKTEKRSTCNPYFYQKYHIIFKRMYFQLWTIQTIS
jgi:hypothetical protein